MIEYTEEDFLSISGISHYTFCRRRWALIHVEDLWEENYFTIDGELMHERVHDSYQTESRGDLFIRRGMYVHSRSLGVSGQCDVVEFSRCDNGIPLNSKPGLWQATPVEYKRGKSRIDDTDRLQLCCQAMCLEEMLACVIPTGQLFYGETKRRESIELTEELRDNVRSALSEMHEMYRRGYTPKVKPSKACSSCSLKELCLPKLLKDESAQKYMQSAMEEE